MKSLFRSNTWIYFALFAALGCFDTAQAQISLSPTTLNFCVASNTSTPPAAQTLTVASSGSAVSYNANGTQPWIRLNGSSTPIVGNTSSSPTISVTLDPSAYASASSNTGQVQVQPSGGATLSATVNVTVSSSCSNVTSATLAATPNPLIFTLAAGTTGPQTATLAVSSSGSSVNVTAAATVTNGNYQWLGVSQPTGILPQNLTVTVDPSSLSTGVTYTGAIALTQNGVPGNSLSVPVYVTLGSSSTVVASPNPISLNIPAGTTTNQTQAVQVSAPVGDQIAVSVNSGTGPLNWLTVSSPLSQVPTSFSVTINPNTLTPGVVYNGSVTVAQVGNTANALTIPVSATLAGNGVLTAGPSAVTFNIAPGTFAQQTQTVTINGPAAPIVVTAQQTNGPSGWLSAPTPSGNLPQQITITVNPFGFTTGTTYNGSILVQQSGNTLSIPVTVTVQGTPTLTVTPTQLSFGYQIGQTAAVPQQALNVSSPAASTVNFSVTTATSSCGNNWLVVSPTQTAATGSTPTPVTVSVNTSGLTTPETCNGVITINAPGASNPTTNVNVSLLVSQNPILSVSPSSLTFNYQPGGAIPASQQLALTSSSSALTYSYSVNPGSSGGPNFLTVTQDVAQTPATLTVAASSNVLATLAPGTYVDNLAVSSTGAGNPTVIVPVTLTIANNPTITAFPSSLVMNYQIGQMQPPAQTITLASTGSPVQFNAAVSTTTCGTFLSVTPVSGNTQATLGQNGTTLTVEASMSGITAPQTCSGTITITSPNSNISVPINVTVNVVNSAVINVGASAIVQSATSGSAVTGITVPLTASDGATVIGYTVTASTNPPGQVWLNEFPQTGFTPSNLNVQLNPANLPAGVYTGAITISSATAVPTQTIPVTYVIAAQASVTPTSLAFTVPAGTTTAAQTLTVNGVPAGTTIAASATTNVCGPNWITTAVAGNTVSVAINGTTFALPGTCTGLISIIVPGAVNSPLIVPVSAAVTNPTVLTPSSASLTFTYPAGSVNTPPSQTVQLAASNSAALPFTTAVTTQSNVNFLTVTPASGNTPAALTVGLNQSVIATLGIGTYTGTITVSSAGLPNAAINVTLSVTAAPPPSLNAIVNAATQQSGPVAPGEIVTIYGVNIGPATPAPLKLTSTGTVPLTLGGVQVFFDGTSAPVVYASANQVNAIVPYEVAGRVQTNITVVLNGVSSPPIQQRATDSQPGIFTANASGSGQGSILNQDNSYNGASNPAAKGSVIQIFATGEGQLNPAGVTGSLTPLTSPFPKPVEPVTVTFLALGSLASAAVTPSYAGEAPGEVSGVLQVNAVVPSGLPSGPVTVVITVGNNASPATVTVNVQ